MVTNYVHAKEVTLFLAAFNKVLYGNLHFKITYFKIVNFLDVL